MTQDGFQTSDLAGCEVLTEAGERLGLLVDVIGSGSNDVWVVQGRMEYMIPALKEVVLDVDLAARRIRVRLPASATFMRPKPRLRIDILTLFPGMLEGPLSESLIGKARQKGSVDLRVRDIRSFSDDKHHTADDRPYGGGPGMVMKPEPLFQALRSCGVPAKKKKGKPPVVVYMSPQGRPLTQALADDLARRKHLVLLCGRYEGIDERIFEWIDLEVSVADVVYTGGEIPALALTDAVVRKVPGTVKEGDSLVWDSFGSGWDGGLPPLHPALWRKRAVPDVLMSGDHKAIQRWRAERALESTKKKRPDLLKKIKEVKP